MAAVVHDLFDGDFPATQRFGERPEYYGQFGLAGHEGTDYGLPVGTVLRAGVSGQVLRAGWGAAGGSAYGNSVVVWDPDQLVALAWCHMSEVDVSVGQHVEPSTRLGLSGATGNVQGPHLHHMICRTDQAGTRLDAGNGFWGWLDELDPAIVTWQTGGGPAPAPPATFTVSVATGGSGAAVRSAPGTGAGLIRIAQDGEQLVIDRYAHYGPALVVNDGWPATDEWFHLGDGSDGWIASACVSGEPGPGVPEVTWSPPPPAPVDPPHTKPAFYALLGVGVFEWDAAAPYAELAAAGARWVAIRGANGDGGQVDQVDAADYRQRAAQAIAAGLQPVAWTVWYGGGTGGFGGVTGDVAQYLADCARHTASLQLETPVWIVDAEDPDLPGLAPALQLLQELSGRPVILCPPGDPTEFGLSWDWPALDQVVEAYMPQIYTSPGAWNGSPNPRGTTDAGGGFQDALAEWTPTPPLLPACDEVDSARIASWCAAAKAAGVAAVGFWRAGVAGDVEAVKAYCQAFSGVGPPPTPAPPPPPLPPPAPAPAPTPAPAPDPDPPRPPVPSPPDPNVPAGGWLAFLRDLCAWILRRLGG